MRIKDEIKSRVIRHARLFLNGDENIRTVASKTGWSKSTVESDLNSRLKNIDLGLYKTVQDKIGYHKTIRHVRGGESTKAKFKRLITSS